MGRDRTETFRRVFRFLSSCETHDKSFTLEDLAREAGWKESSARTNVAKKLGDVIVKLRRGEYRASGVRQYKEDEFVRLLSQNQAVSADPKKPQLEPKVEGLVRKARESALLALQIYNNPTTAFKTEAYSVLMVIAWTSLFHAIFERDQIGYFYLEDDGTPKVVDGDEKAWELSTCASQWWKSEDSPVKRNLEFFVKLRNRVEHRYVPGIDATVAGECQALLLNFDDLLTEQFGSYFAMREYLAVPLQTGALRTANHLRALKQLQADQFEEVRGFVDDYRRGLTDEVLADEKYCFRAYLIPKTGNHRSSSDRAIEFVRAAPEHPEELEKLQANIVAIRDRRVPVVNADLLSPSNVVEQVAAQLGKPFKMHHHTAAWKRYKVRPEGDDPKRFGECKTEFCVPDARHGDYSYTAAWVKFLLKKLDDDGEYRALTAKEAKNAHST